MGTLRGDNGGGRPPDGGGLPDLPPEWGTIVIPDDAAELSREATAVRRELRRFARRNRWRRRLHRPPLTEANSADTPTLGLPILIMAIAILATMTSLFALAWPGPVAHPAASTPVRASVSPPTVPDLTLIEAGGRKLPLRNSLPAVLLLADGCGCVDLELATAEAVPAGVTVLAVARIAPPLPTAVPLGLRLVAVADADGALRAAYASAPLAAGVVAVLIRVTGEVVRTVRSVTTVDDFRADLSKLV
jgi:hypothetical protein